MVCSNSTLAAWALRIPNDNKSDLDFLVGLTLMKATDRPEEILNKEDHVC